MLLYFHQILKSIEVVVFVWILCVDLCPKLTCIAVCGVPPIPTGAEARNYNPGIKRYENEHAIHYRCADGGTSTVICHYGKWTGQLVKCGNFFILLHEL